MGILTIDINCPHCLRENAVIQAFAEKRKGNSSIYDVAFYCRSCEKSLIAEVEAHGIGTGGPFQASKMSDNVNVSIPGDPMFTLLNVYPESRSHSAPNDTPIRAAKFFIEAKDNFQRQRYETSVMLCRKVLDISTREILGEDSKNEQLSQRISMLYAKGKITEQMKDWAHIVRMDSNGAVHSDEEFSEEEANQMISFTEVFMIYSFTLPSMVAARQNKPKEQ
ncbi:DUF4145 domain-containing protein [Enterobacter sp. TMH.L2]